MKHVLSIALLSLTLGCAGSRAAPEAKPTAEKHTAITTEALEPYTCGTVQRLHTIQGLFLASQPQAADFEQAKAGGVKTVVDLRKPSEDRGFDERSVVATLGLGYVAIPWNGADELTDAVFDQARAMFRDVQRPALIHCSSGNRIGPLWIAWRTLDQGTDLEAAVAEARTIGMKTADYEAKARDYVARQRAQR